MLEAHFVLFLSSGSCSISATSGLCENISCLNLPLKGKHRNSITYGNQLPKEAFHKYFHKLSSWLSIYCRLETKHIQYFMHPTNYVCRLNILKPILQNHLICTSPNGAKR